RPREAPRDGDRLVGGAARVALARVVAEPARDVQVAAAARAGEGDLDRARRGRRGRAGSGAERRQRDERGENEPSAPHRRHFRRLESVLVSKPGKWDVSDKAEALTRKGDDPKGWDRASIRLRTHP